MRHITFFALLAIAFPALAQAPPETYNLAVDKSTGVGLLWLATVAIAFAAGWFVNAWRISHKLQGASFTQVKNEVLTNSRAADIASNVVTKADLQAYTKYIVEQVNAAVAKVNPPSPPAA